MIEREIVSGVRHGGGAQVDELNFRWRGGQKLIPPPPSIELKITTSAQTLNLSFAREEVEDSWERVDRADVRAKIRNLVSKLTGV